MSTPPRARVVTATQPPPREVEYQAEDSRDDIPRPRRTRSPLAGLIIYAFIGGVIGFVPVFGYFFAVQMSGANIPNNQATTAQRVIGSGILSLIPALAVFFICACVGSFVWAMTRPRR